MYVLCETGFVECFDFLTDLKVNDIADTTVAAGAFKTLVAAIQAAVLVDTLKGTGPFRPSPD